MKTLGADYTEEAVAARIAGKPRPSRLPRQGDGRISLLIDIQNNLKARESSGFAHWAKINNLKQAAKTMNFLTEHGIACYEELEKRLETLTARRETALADIRETEERMTDLSMLMKHATTYWKLKPVYDSYRNSPDKEKFLRGHEGDIILFEAAARQLKERNLKKIPAFQSMKAEYDALAAKKEALYPEYRKARAEAKEYEVIRQNVDALLSIPKEPDRDRSQEYR